MTKSPTHWGALPEDWDNLDIHLGYTADLLPVVSNPRARKSPYASVEKMGEVPSIYNCGGLVIGKRYGTKRMATDREVNEWKQQPDYGICIQTRYVRGIHVKVRDVKLSYEIRDYIASQYKFPIRFRRNSVLFLTAFRVRGDVQCSVLRGDKENGWGSRIEFLGSGQQFVAYGTHTTGARYKWDWQGLHDFPKLTIEQYNVFKADLAERFAAKMAEVESKLRKRRT